MITLGGKTEKVKNKINETDMCENNVLTGNAFGFGSVRPVTAVTPQYLMRMIEFKLLF